MSYSNERKCVGSYERLDGCYGTVIATCRSGAFLILDNEEEAYAYKFANLRPGTKVLCTVQHPAEPGKRQVVSIDHVCYVLYV